MSDKGYPIPVFSKGQTEAFSLPDLGYPVFVRADVPTWRDAERMYRKKIGREDALYASFIAHEYEHIELKTGDESQPLEFEQMFDEALLKAGQLDREMYVYLTKSINKRRDAVGIVH
jgi:hypothetical protein